MTEPAASGSQSGVRVFYEQWQMACCGDPFSVGDDVKWTGAAAGAFHQEWLGGLAAGVDWLEEHHRQPDDPPERPIEGTVKRIQAVWEQLAQDPPGSAFLKSVPGTQVAVDLATVQRRASTESRPESGSGLSFRGYLVTLEPSRL